MTPASLALFRRLPSLPRKIPPSFPRLDKLILLNILTTLPLSYHLIIPCHKIRELKASLVKTNITQCLMNIPTFVFIEQGCKSSRSYSSIYNEKTRFYVQFNPLNAKLNPICHLLALLGAHHILHVSRIRVKDLYSLISEEMNSIFQGWNPL